MNAAASSLIEAIKYAFGSDPYTYPPGPNGTDWDNIPSGATSWYKYGSGGVNSWGSLCGVPNGCIAVLNMMNLHSAFAEKIMLYSCQTEFPLRGLHDIFLSDPWVTDSHDPNYLGPEPMPDDEVLAYTIANSPLCHVSVSKWAHAAGVSMTATTPYATAHKTDRCAKTAASVASFVAELLNGVTSGLIIPPATAECMTCHTTSSSVSPAQQGKMDCLECHTDGRPHFGPRVVVENVWTADGSGNPKTDFIGGDQIQFNVRFSVMGQGSWLVETTQRAGVLAPCGKKLFTKSETLTSGLHEWTWSGTLPGGGCVGQGKFNTQLALKNLYGTTLSTNEMMCVFNIG
jgi:hypothetical protein